MPVLAPKKTSPPRKHPTGCKGSSIAELLAVIAITIALVMISVPLYYDYIDKAKVTLALDTLDTIQKIFKSYQEEYQEYPPEPTSALSQSFFFTGRDSKGRTVFQSNIIEQISDDISAVSYTSTKGTYTFTAKGKDSKQTLMTVTPEKISY